MTAWVADDIGGTTIHRALVRNHGVTEESREALAALPKLEEQLCKTGSI